MFSSIRRYIDMILSAAAVASLLWYGVVQPRIQKLVRDEITFQNYLLMEIATDEQLKDATTKWQAFKEKTVK